MYYCKVCQEKNKWPASLAKSIRNCEVCGTRDLCNDVKSSNLSVIKKNDMEFTKGELEAIGSSKSKFKDAYFIRLKNKKDSFIAKTYGHTGFPAEANAKELVRRWNAFEDGGLVDELRKAIDQEYTLRLKIEKQRDKLRLAALAKS